MAMCINVLLLLLVFAGHARTRPCSGSDGCFDSKSASSSFSVTTSASESRNSSASSSSSQVAQGPQNYSYVSSSSSRQTYESSFRSNSSSGYASSYEGGHVYTSGSTDRGVAVAESSREAETALEEDDDGAVPPDEAPVLPAPLPSPTTHERTVETQPPRPPPEFYPCGYPKPVDPDHPETASESGYYATPDGVPCPVTPSVKPSEPVTETTAPAPVVPEKKQKREPVVREDPKPAPAVVHEEPKTKSVEQPAVTPVPKPFGYSSSPIRSKDSAVTAARVKHFLDAKDVAGLAAFVVESDDIYGLTKGFLFEDHEREAELQKSDTRQTDKDVVALKALATAALTPEAKLKVIEIMVLTATSPDGYHFNEHRPLVESFVEIFYNDDLLRQVIQSDAQTYARRRLLCVGCTPVNSYVCAHCWPNSICKAYFWCRGKSSGSSAAARSSSPSKSSPAASDGKQRSNDAASSKTSQSKKGNRRPRRRRRNRKQTRRAHSSRKSSPP